MGYSAYRAELEEKMEILRKLLLQYNDGRRKTFYCTAVSLLELPDVRRAMEEVREAMEAEQPQDVKERSAIDVLCFKRAADGREIYLKLRKKPKKG